MTPSGRVFHFALSSDSVKAKSTSNDRQPSDSTVVDSAMDHHGSPDFSLLGPYKAQANPVKPPVVTTCGP